MKLPFSVLRLLPVLLAVVLLAACGKDDSSDPAGTPPVQFTMGEPVADTTIALIIQVGSYADTLGAEGFLREYIQRVQENPYLMADSLGARELRRQIVEEYVYQVVLDSLSKSETGLTVDTSLADMQLLQMQQQAQQQGTTLDAQLERMGITADSLRTFFIGQLRMRAMAERLAERAAMPTEAEVETFRAERAEEVRLQHIMFVKQPGMAEASLDSIRQVAEAVRDSAVGGTAFADLARRHSQDGNAANGGDLDFLRRGAGLPPTLEKAAFALSDSGDVAPVVESPIGYHILRLTGRRTGVPMDTTRARQSMLNERKTDAVKQALAEAVQRLGVVVRVNPEIVQMDLNDRYDEGAE